MSLLHKGLSQPGSRFSSCLLLNFYIASLVLFLLGTLSWIFNPVHRLAWCQAILALYMLSCQLALAILVPFLLIAYPGSVLVARLAWFHFCCQIIQVLFMLPGQPGFISVAKQSRFYSCCQASLVPVYVFRQLTRFCTCQIFIYSVDNNRKVAIVN